jgi:hypothetical protein
MQKLLILIFCISTIAVSEEQPTVQTDAKPAAPVDVKPTTPGATQPEIQPEVKSAAPTEAKPAAQEQTYQIKQLHLDKNRAIVTSTQELREGSDLLATFANGKQCSLSVTASKDGIANVDTSKCANANDLVVGQKLEPSLLIDDTKKAEPTPIQPTAETPVKDAKKDSSESTSRRIRGSAYLLWNTASDAKFNNVYVQQGANSGTGSADFEMDKAFGLGIEIYQSDENRWGWAAGFALEGKRNINSVNVASGSVTVN